MPTLKNNNHEAFAQAWADPVLERRTLVDLYRIAYPDNTLSEDNIRKRASQVSKNPLVVERREELLAKTNTDRTLTRQRIREIVAAIANDEEAKASDRLAACAAESKMMGYDQPEKVDHKITVVLRTDFDTTD